jgi:hypothetical protein
MNSSSKKPSPTHAARQLGFSRATITRKLSVPQSGTSSSALILQRLSLERGAVPAPVLAHFSRTSALILKALSQKPLGVASARTLARLACVAPATATGDLRKLSEAGLVTNADGVWQIAWTSRMWQAVAQMLGKVKLPFHQPFGVRSPKYVPQRFWPLFQDVNPHSFEIDGHETLIISRILNSNDLVALSWMAKTFPPSRISQAVGALRRDLRSDREQLAEVLSRSRRGH